MTGRLALAAMSLGLALGTPAAAQAAEVLFEAPVATRTADEGTGEKVAIFAGGCFWGVEAVFSHVKGVKSVVSGYHGGNRQTATYRQVSSGFTQHAEAVRVVYDPKVVRYDQLLQILFSVIADPTLKDRQGPDKGPHYRTALVPLSREQREVAAAYLEQMGASGVWKGPIVTRIEDYRAFYRAEDYHQDFMRKNPAHPYIVRWDKPKVDALKQMFPQLYRAAFRTG